MAVYAAELASMTVSKAVWRAAYVDLLLRVIDLTVGACKGELDKEDLPLVPQESYRLESFKETIDFLERETWEMLDAFRRFLRESARDPYGKEAREALADLAEAYHAATGQYMAYSYEEVWLYIWNVVATDILHEDRLALKIDGHKPVQVWFAITVEPPLTEAVTMRLFIATVWEDGEEDLEVMSKVFPEVWAVSVEDLDKARNLGWSAIEKEEVKP